MPRGQLDYGMYAPKTVGAGLSDMSELAARLGSIVSYDRRGMVVELDDFESTVLRFTTHFGDSGGTAAIDATSVKSGQQSCKLHTPAVAGTYTYISKELPVLSSKRLGGEISFSNLSTNCDFRLEVTYTDGTYTHHAIVKVDPVTLGLYILDENESWQLIGTLHSLRSVAMMFHIIKLVCDLDTDKYVRLLFDNEEYDISAYSFYVGPGTDEPLYYCNLSITNRNASGGDVWVDDLIFTQDEP